MVTVNVLDDKKSLIVQGDWFPKPRFRVMVIQLWYNPVKCDPTIWVPVIWFIGAGATLGLP